jgi:hypothetical protein
MHINNKINLENTDVGLRLITNIIVVCVSIGRSENAFFMVHQSNMYYVHEKYVICTRYK